MDLMHGNNITDTRNSAKKYRTENKAFSYGNSKDQKSSFKDFGLNSASMVNDKQASLDLGNREQGILRCMSANLLNEYSIRQR
jgi:hypothetical protein